ncbi:TetR/AcrR family transcriptional regulator [Krasilnikovia cinnamomea]|uniref:TetR/AcrR family transcriptional regulator n=1 Tax=Krasilnikovia cinnamomea TaxID=349313 RepID=UPI00102C056C|nr:TetR/AcrR family transcriptional regulator [Krasilnikovia cinnamomea]
MPRLWNETIEEHRGAVRDAVLDAAAALVAEHGLTAVTMSKIAERTGIGRATLYKYFPDIEAILLAWHERQIAGHLQHLAAAREHGGDAQARLAAVLEVYALNSRQRHGGELAAMLHQSSHTAAAHERLVDFVRDLLAEAVTAGTVRRDVPSAELAAYCLSALSAARTLPSDASVRRLVTVTLAGLRPAS